MTINIKKDRLFEGNHKVDLSRRMETLFCCPTCHAPVRMEENRYVCTACRKCYPIVDSIPVFCDSEAYYGEVDRARMTSLIEDANKYGYDRAIKNYLNDPFVYRYAADEKRSKWMEILPINRDTIFLDVGCGWGTNTLPISRKVGTIVALDATYERAKFVQIRSEQSQAENVVAVTASAIKLPFPAGYFDIVAFNGVLEWLGAVDKRLEPRELQMRALVEAHRVVKPGGMVYVGIENRYSLRYMLGVPDDHSFLRFTSLMPRKLANIYCRLVKDECYYTHTHSLQQYKNMFAEAGFEEVNCYFPWPNYRNPTKIVLLEKEAILEALSEIAASKKFGPGWVYIKLLYFLTILEGSGRLCHSFCLTARKGGVAHGNTEGKHAT